jgi:hypothetical protein
MLDLLFPLILEKLRKTNLKRPTHISRGLWTGYTNTERKRKERKKSDKDRTKK